MKYITTTQGCAEKEKELKGKALQEKSEGREEKKGVNLEGMKQEKRKLTLFV